MPERCLAIAAAVVCGLLSLTAVPRQSAAASGQLPLAPCRIEHPSGISAVTAECGTLEVAENPAEPQGRQIALHVARIAAVSRRRQPDPLFVIAGGPGMAATAFYAGAAPAFERIRRERDIVLVEQRGTGRSGALTCAFDEERLLQASEAHMAAEVARCLARLQQRANVALYTTSLAVQDLDRVRAALGYERINLYGVSYGTRVAQHYVRRFPQHVRSMILDGVVPPQVALGPELALHAERALQSILERCANAAPCRESFGDPGESYRALRERLDERPVEVMLTDPASGEARRLEFTELHLAMVLRLASYTPEQAALLPLALHLAHREGEFRPLAAQFLLVSRSYDDLLAYGMHNTVVCTEDVPFYAVTSAERERLRETYLGTLQLDALIGMCAGWPRGPIDADFKETLVADVPALLLSGGDDPVTPPAYAEQALRGLSRGRHVVLPGMGHGQLTAACVDRLMAEFVARTDAEALDVSCTRRIAPMPFFTSLAGPAP